MRLNSQQRHWLADHRDDIVRLYIALLVTVSVILQAIQLNGT